MDNEQRQIIEFCKQIRQDQNIRPGQFTSGHRVAWVVFQVHTQSIFQDPHI